MTEQTNARPVTVAECLPLLEASAHQIGELDRALDLPDPHYVRPYAITCPVPGLLRVVFWTWNGRGYTQVIRTYALTKVDELAMIQRTS